MDAWLKKLGIAETNPGMFCGDWRGGGSDLESISPVDGLRIAAVQTATSGDCAGALERAQAAFAKWRLTPAPVRGETVRRFGNALRAAKPDLARLVTIETGKIIAEAEGEVQEMIDICDFAVGLSRQLYGLTIASERPKHRLMEQWHPLGVVGVITAFNFPVAVWAWNSALALVCGDAVAWKPSSKTPLSAIAVIKLSERVCAETGADPALFALLIGSGKIVGEYLTADPKVPLVSATGSCEMGVELARQVHGRLGRTILELGGNNAVIVAPSANLDLAIRAIFFGAIGTAGQRCTSTRRVIVHESLLRDVKTRLREAYRATRIGNPLDPQTTIGPLIDTQAVETMLQAIARLKREGGKILYGGERLTGKEWPGDCYVTPCVAEVPGNLPLVKEETFAPLLYLMPYRDFEQAVALNNEVPQGLSSAIFTNNALEAEEFLSACGSDCGIANVNVGTSGAEIGGAFGGEKSTGGGRESGSDAWKAYMRRQTSTINYSAELPLAQGIRFGVENEKHP